MTELMMWTSVVGILLALGTMIGCFAKQNEHMNAIRAELTRRSRPRQKYFIRMLENAPMVVYASEREARESLSTYGGRIVTVEEADV